MSTAASRMLARVIVVIALIGLADSAWIGEWDLVVLFAAVAVLALAGSAALGRRRSIGLRADLLAWANDRARRTGEAPEDVVERAVAAQRRALEPDRTGKPTVGDIAS